MRGLGESFLPSSFPSKTERDCFNSMSVYRERDFRLGHYELRGKRAESIDILEAQESLLWMNFERVTGAEAAQAGRQAGARSPL